MFGRKLNLAISSEAGNIPCEGGMPLHFSLESMSTFENITYPTYCYDQARGTG